MSIYPMYIIIILVVAFLASAIRILLEYERAVIFTLGRFTSVKGPGFFIVIPFVQKMVRVELRTIVMDVPSQDVISRDNVSVKVNAVVYFRVVDPEKAIIQVENFYMATSQLAQTTLRSVLGQHELDEMLAERERLNIDIQTDLDEQTDAWGIKVSNVEIKHVDLDESMVRAIARQAEAESDSRRRRNAGLGEITGGREDPVRTTAGNPVALFADPHRDRRRQEQHHRLPSPHRSGGILDAAEIIMPVIPAEQRESWNLTGTREASSVTAPLTPLDSG